MPNETLVRLATSFGDIDIALDHAHAPITAAHFRNLVARDLFEGAGFYRVVRRAATPGQLPTIDIIQGGLGFDKADQLPPVQHEPTNITGLRHLTGIISLARGAEHPANGEFFICLEDLPILDAGGQPGAGAGGFAAFGQVVAGMDTVRAIHQLPAVAPPPPGWEILAGQFLAHPIAFKARLI